MNIQGCKWWFVMLLKCSAHWDLGFGQILWLLQGVFNLTNRYPCKKRANGRMIWFFLCDTFLMVKNQRKRKTICKSSICKIRSDALIWHRLNVQWLCCCWILLSQLDSFALLVSLLLAGWFRELSDLHCSCLSQDWGSRLIAPTLYDLIISMSISMSNTELSWSSLVLASEKSCS